jgi:GntP family gluconate:H+ symporter
MEISALGAILGLLLAIVLILKKVEPTYAMIGGAIFGGLVGGASLSSTVSIMIGGVAGMSSAILRIVTAGILAGVLIESGAAARIAESITKKLGESKSLIAMMIATWILTAVGVFGDVAIITVSPIAILMAKKAGFNKLGVLLAMIGGVKAGNVMSPNPNAISAAEAFGLPLTSVMIAGILPAVVALVTTTFLAKRLAYKGTSFEGVHESEDETNVELPSIGKAVIGPVVTIGLLLLRPIAGITIDPLIALPAGGIAGLIAMGKAKHFVEYFSSGLSKMSGVVLLLIGTGTLSGIISNSELTTAIVDLIEVFGLPGYLLAPISGILMGAGTASATAGTTLGSQIFGPVVLESGIAPLAAAAMTHAGSFVFDGLPHGSFFHVSAGAVDMEISERLKLIPYESLIGLMMVLSTVLVYGILGVLN